MKQQRIHANSLFIALIVLLVLRLTAGLLGAQVGQVFCRDIGKDTYWYSCLGDESCTGWGKNVVSTCDYECVDMLGEPIPGEYANCIYHYNGM